MLRNYIILYVSLFVVTTKWPSAVSDDSQDVSYERDSLLFDDSSFYDYSDSDETNWPTDRQQNTEFDVIIFTQQWPVTTCYHWRETDKDRKCVLPQRKEFWTIHGLWPTKLGHLGPNFCNKSIPFNVDKLDSIVDKLNVYWPDIDADDIANKLWEHEWAKHGTCAMQLQDLGDELKYFAQGLQWRQRYLISNILDASNIHPDSNSTVTALQMALLQGLGKNPYIHCIYDKKHDLSLLSEIRICFDKSLELIDCDGVQMGDATTVEYPGGTVITNCIISKQVHYPSLVPPVERKKQRNNGWTSMVPTRGKNTFPLVNIYKLVQFIMWSTL